MDLSSLQAKLDEARYIHDSALATTLLVALKLGRPLLIEARPAWARRRWPR